MTTFLSPADKNSFLNSIHRIADEPLGKLEAWKVTSENGFEKTDFKGLVVEKIKGFFNFFGITHFGVDQTNASLQEYVFLQMLEQGKENNTLTPSNLETIKKAAKNIGLMKTNGSSEKADVFSDKTIQFVVDNLFTKGQEVLCKKQIKNFSESHTVVTTWVNSIHHVVQPIFTVIGEEAEEKKEDISDFKQDSQTGSGETFSENEGEILHPETLQFQNTEIPESKIVQISKEPLVSLSQKTGYSTLTKLAIATFATFVAAGAAVYMNQSDTTNPQQPTDTPNQPNKTHPQQTTCPSNHSGFLPNDPLVHSTSTMTTRYPLFDVSKKVIHFPSPPQDNSNEFTGTAGFPSGTTTSPKPTVSSQPVSPQQPAHDSVKSLNKKSEKPPRFEKTKDKTHNVTQASNIILVLGALLGAITTFVANSFFIPADNFDDYFYDQEDEQEVNDGDQEVNDGDNGAGVSPPSVTLDNQDEDQDNFQLDNQGGDPNVFQVGNQGGGLGNFPRPETSRVFSFS